MSEVVTKSYTLRFLYCLFAKHGTATVALISSMMWIAFQVFDSSISSINVCNSSLQNSVDQWFKFICRLFNSLSPQIASWHTKITFEELDVFFKYSNWNLARLWSLASVLTHLVTSHFSLLRSAVFPPLIKYCNKVYFCIFKDFFKLL